MAWPEAQADPEGQYPDRRSGPLYIVFVRVAHGVDLGSDAAEVSCSASEFTGVRSEEGEVMARYIERSEVLRIATKYHDLMLAYELAELPTADVVEVVRCKDCVHRPKGTNKHDLEFPDYVCPCQCDDFWYSWMPPDDWWCASGKRKEGDAK